MTDKDKIEDPLPVDEEISLEAEELVGETEFVGCKRGRSCSGSCSTTCGSHSNKVSKGDMIDKFMECMIYTLAAKERFYEAIAERYRAAGTAISSDDRFSIPECIRILQITEGISYSIARKAIAAFKNSLEDTQIFVSLKPEWRRNWVEDLDQ